MNIWVVLIALGLNILAGRVFRPYSSVIINLSAEFSRKTAKWRYKKIVMLSTVIIALIAVIIWVAVDCAILFLQYNSKIYAYMCNTAAIFLCLGCGQFSALTSKIAKNEGNDVYVKQLFSYLLIKDAERLDRKNYKKAFNEATVRYIAERIVAPAVIMLVLGAGALLAYTFINTVARCDDAEDVETHGFAVGAIKINRAFSWCGYVMLTLFLWAAKWVCGIKKSFKNVNDLAKRCEAQLECFDADVKFTKKTAKTANAAMYVITAATLLVVIAFYIFIQAVFATLGLDEYWDFWNGENTGEELW